MSEPVIVALEYTGAGVWGRFTGHTACGEHVTVSGAIVGGPDEHEGGLAVQIRRYKGLPDMVLYTAADAVVELVDDPADHEARAEHGLNPVFGPVKRAEFMEWIAGKSGRKHDGWWKWLPPADDPAAGQVEAWEHNQGSPVMMVAVHRGHLPIGGGA